MLEGALLPHLLIDLFCFRKKSLDLISSFSAVDSPIQEVHKHRRRVMKHVEFGMDLEIKHDIQGEATKGHNVTHVLYTGEQSDSILESNDRS